MMKTMSMRRLLALALAAVMCAVLLVGCGDAESEEESKTNEIVAQQGGEPVPFAEGFDTTQRFGIQVEGDTMSVAFNGIERGTTRYFTAAGDTLTLTASATVEHETRLDFRAVLWKQVDGGAEYSSTEEHPGTMEFVADGNLYTAQFTGLEPGAQYKIALAYDGRDKYRMSGQLSVQGLAGAEAPEEGQEGGEA